MAFKFFKIFANFLTVFDQFPVPVSLLVKGESDIKNTFGGIVSILSIIWSLYLTWGSIIDYVQNSNPTVVTSTQYDIEEDILEADNFFVSLGFFEMKKNGTGFSSSSNDLNKTQHKTYENSFKHFQQ